jgi:hypothetical protein
MESFFSWETAFAVGAAILLIALIFGVRASRTRRRSNDPITDAAVMAQRRDPEGYDPKPFRERLRP